LNLPVDCRYRKRIFIIIHMTGLPLQLLLYVVVIASVIWYSIPQSQAGATPHSASGREAMLFNDTNEQTGHPQRSSSIIKIKEGF
jgi:hypothetical protein